MSPITTLFTLPLSEVIYNNYKKYVSSFLWSDSALYKLTHGEPQTVEHTVDILTNRLLFEAHRFI